MFDEQPDGDPHGECEAEIRRLQRELDDAKRLLDDAAHQVPAGYQQFINGKWEHCSAFLAFGFRDEMFPGFRAVYAAPVPAGVGIAIRRFRRVFLIRATTKNEPCRIFRSARRRG